VSGSREGSVSPSTRKRKKVNQRRKSLAETNNLLGMRHRPQSKLMLYIYVFIMNFLN